MEQKTIVVTGAASGIGRAIAVAYAGAGWRVFGLDVDAVDLAGVTGVTCDVGDEDSVAAAFAGIDALDLLVNNAGVADPHRGPVEDLSLADWRRVTDSHLTGAFLMTRAAVTLLRTAKGAIVNMASTRHAMSEPHSEAYAASKGGIVALTHALAISLGPDVRVNAIAPGWIVTDGWDDLRAVDHAQHPVGRAGRVADIVDAVRYLTEAGFVTGQVLTVDGGMTRKMIYAD
ncbi:SDR family NAD(P)-dependent oxidoreductase [Loktanella sp. M215]|uniref:SDR family NAD(P)-dependent oxidoreductase n=1 Tax=Loktanella sp. M215 TaxID=2675431 RepID=UPI001F198C0C|nr:SDR family oxidoreductase [Loktanella sp. M215]MCF7699239.1 SDR family oxidoreductase [Loktanella sp. M215]